jgi:hypothetical protein
MSKITPQKARDLSASVFRMLWLMQITEMENSFFSEQLTANSMGKDIVRLMKNSISTIRGNVRLIKMLLPNSTETIDREIESEKIPYVSSILEKLTYMTVEQLAEVDESIVLRQVDEVETN